MVGKAIMGPVAGWKGCYGSTGWLVRLRAQWLVGWFEKLWVQWLVGKAIMALVVCWQGYGSCGWLAMLWVHWLVGKAMDPMDDLKSYRSSGWWV